MKPGAKIVHLSVTRSFDLVFVVNTYSAGWEAAEVLGSSKNRGEDEGHDGGLHCSCGSVYRVFRDGVGVVFFEMSSTTDDKQLEEGGKKEDEEEKRLACQKKLVARWVTVCNTGKWQRAISSPYWVPFLALATC